jgi:hypothetical protein
MTALTDFAENRLIDWFFRGQAVPAIAGSWFFGLLTAATDDDGSPLTEVSGGSYARAAVPRSLANFAGTQAPASVVVSSGASGTTSNNVDINFPAPTADWGSVVAIGLFDAAVGGNMWIYGPLAAAKTVANGDAPPRFPAAAFSFQFDN